LGHGVSMFVPAVRTVASVLYWVAVALLLVRVVKGRFVNVVV
jgi:hypothetical protein